MWAWGVGGEDKIAKMQNKETMCQVEILVQCSRSIIEVISVVSAWSSSAFACHCIIDTSYLFGASGVDGRAKIAKMQNEETMCQVENLV